MSAGGLSTIPPYSLQATVAAVQDYFALLTDMYLDPADVLTPACMGKTGSVLDLLRHLPYIRREEDDGPQAGIPGCHFADWRHLAEITSIDPDNDTGPDGHSLRECSEPVELVERDVIPPYVIGLTYGGRDNPTFLLDTKHGIVHWYECPDGIRYDSALPGVTDVDEPFDWEDTPEEELRELRHVPVGSPSRAVLYGDGEDAEEELGDLVVAVRAIFKRHGWPDPSSFDKEVCLAEVKRLVMDEYPDHDYRYDDDEDDADEESEGEEGDGEGSNDDE
ncbi:hypothetical protein QBC37DRAFT_457765 [Rhypophila decipiens]|uniref:Uncharacterized protein n=1 Tax=Rhypophila decipiens TaxID=261697 RepID=A0AAN7B3B6_9PEZI|nr:hypothetical protein QBC37DRAFT_457765 [Rhypophila decipiens]